ncbi:uncharacterized protein PgNI_04712 [Pyricularia grisea]|uniref:Uncharacterized protein n=1 Tax=Pyricularia grisea TaxID=148305 RepID=A0A6P8BCL2_PYRGI|nr:uncharacterized protein PgNI_04712 [Pyricularia grisea]TLD13442.1 hypothetical protein PgNI_04712 [Pyricularia grisea]
MNSRGKPVASCASSTDWRWEHRRWGRHARPPDMACRVHSPRQGVRLVFATAILAAVRPIGSPRPDEAEKESVMMGIDLLGMRGKKRLESP